jgi:ABC-type transporter Mla subunit MlaD
MRLLKKDTFVKDILILLIVGMTVSALFAAGFAMATDKYFAKAVTGIMGDFGQYDLLFQGKQELKGALERQIRAVIAERFPGATLKPGISLIGKTSFFLTLPIKYKTKAVFDNLSYYFNNLPGNGGFSIMTEPRINISSVPSGVFELLSGQVEQIPGVLFTFHDGNSIGIILKNTRASETVQRRIKQIINRYQILEVRLNAGHSRSELLTLGKRVAQSLLRLPGVNYARDLSLSDSANDYQYMVNTLMGIKKFLLAYATEVTISPAAGEDLAVGELVALKGKGTQSNSGTLLNPLDIVVKVTSKDVSGIRGLIIQGDVAYLGDNQAYRLLPGDKIGACLGTVAVSSRKSQLAYAMEQGANLLKQVQGALDNYDRATGGPGLTLTEFQKVTTQLRQVKQALNLIEANLSGGNARTNRGYLVGAVNLLSGVGDDLDYLAKTFGRVRILENRFNKALEGFGTARGLVGSSVLQNALGISGGALDKLRGLDSRLGLVENSLRERVRQLDDFINRFNPVVAVLLSWRNQARDFAAQVNDFSATFTPGTDSHRKLTELIAATDRVATALSGENFTKAQSGLDLIAQRLFNDEKLDLRALIAELEKAKDALPQLLDEEIGHSVDLIDRYVGGETTTGEKIQVFTQARIVQPLVETAIKKALNQEQLAVFSLPVGTIQPDIRGELFKILAEVRSTIAALLAVVLWIFSFILDQSLIVAMLKQWNLHWRPFKVEPAPGILNRVFHGFVRLFHPANLYAAVVGGLWLGVTTVLSGARIPYLAVWQVALGGGLFGMVLAVLAEKINPINQEEVLAGLSLGLPFGVIMREIVIPAGRPGLLQLLNRWKMIMR